MSVKFGAVTHAVGHRMSFEQTLAAIRGIGFESILLLTSREAEPVGAGGTSRSPFPNVLASDPEHVLRGIRNAGLEVGALHFAGRIDVSTDEGIDPTVAALKEYGAYALALGCLRLTHPVPSCGRSRVPTEEKEAEIRRLAACMNAVAEAFSRDGLRIGVDIHHRGWVEGVEDCRLLLEAMPCPNAGILLNIGHMTTAESYGWLLVEEYPDRIPAVGWKDHSLARGRPRPMWSVELGTGHSPFEIYIGAFRRHPADRAHFINCENVPDADRVGCLKRSKAYLEALWDSDRIAGSAPGLHREG